MLVSVIITTRNEEKHIGACLDSIQRQTYPRGNTEIIVVDNGSSDRTKDIARQYTDQVYDKGPERSAQRNFGVDCCQGDYFLYLDADMILSEEVLSHCVVRITEDPALAGIYISEVVMGNQYFSKVRRFERSFYEGTVIDAVRFIKKSAFLQVGGFDEQLTGPEDWDLDKKIRQAGPVALITTPIYHNEAEFDLKKYLSKKGYYARDIDVYLTKWGKDDPDIRKQYGLWYRFVGVFTEQGKWKRLLRHPLLAGGMYFLRLLVGIKFLTRT